MTKPRKWKIGRMPSKGLVEDLIEAALDQPYPTPALSGVLNVVLNVSQHENRLGRAAQSRQSMLPGVHE